MLSTTDTGTDWVDVVNCSGEDCDIQEIQDNEGKSLMISLPTEFNAMVVGDIKELWVSVNKMSLWRR